MGTSVDSGLGICVDDGSGMLFDHPFQKAQVYTCGYLINTVPFLLEINVENSTDDA